VSFTSKLKSCGASKIQIGSHFLGQRVSFYLYWSKRELITLIVLGNVSYASTHSLGMKPYLFVPVFTYADELFFPSPLATPDWRRLASEASEGGRGGKASSF
jgi:hypothetical protein